MDEQNVDPFDGLHDWAKDVERRAKRAHRLRRLRSAAALRRRRPRRPVGQRGGGVMWVAIIVIVLGLLATVPNLLSRRSVAAGRYPRQDLPAGVYATTTATAGPSSPFEGTPALYYPRGEAGITLPPATAVDGFTAAQLDAALQQVRTALVAGRLDHEMLVDHLPARFVGLLAPNDQTAVGKWFAAHRFIGVATWIDPAAHLDPAELPRVSGRVTVASAVVDGVPTLRITTNFVWVYAFTGTHDRIAAIHDQVRWDFPDEKKVRPGDAGMCDPQVHDTEDPNAYLKPDHALAIADDCPKTPAR